MTQGGPMDVVVRRGNDDAPGAPPAASTPAEAPQAAYEGRERGPSIEAHHSPFYPVFKRGGILMVPPIVLLLVWTRWQWPSVPGAWATGLPLFVLGVALRVWAQRYLKYRLRQGRWLTVVGPYAWTRNPV